MKIQEAMDSKAKEAEIDISSQQVSMLCMLVGKFGPVRLVGSVAGILGEGEFEKD